MRTAELGPRESALTSARGFLGPGGPLCRALAGYEGREGQLVMAEAVERALAEESVLFCEAGTGTGKTLAYLVPALLSGKKVVISTATRALQEQIVGKDLPLLRQALGFEPRVALMKGLANYVCLRRYREFVSSAEALRPGYARALRALESFIDGSSSGDVSELAALREDDPIWSEVTASSDTRIGPNCAHHAECFVTRTKREAEAAQVVIVNHHLFFADLALRGPHPGRVIPDYDAVIFDEAHQLEDIATNFFGVRVSQGRIERLLRDMTRALALSGCGEPLFAGGRGTGVFGELSAATEALFAELAGRVSREDARSPLERDDWQGALKERWHRLDSALEASSLALEEFGRRALSNGIRPGKQLALSSLAEAFELGARRAEALREELAAVVDGGRGRITWFERSATRGGVLSSAPVSMGWVFRARVFETIPAVILTSATLSNAATPARDAAEPQTSGEAEHAFSFVRQRLGVNDASVTVKELVVPSPFDFERRALFYTPRDLALPTAPEFLGQAAGRIIDLVGITGGGAFVLTTSLRSMHALHRQLEAGLRGLPVFVQGQMPKGTLVSAFRAAGNAVLVATLSFWEGVDVPGHALRLVVLEKIPFPVPTDPMVHARTLSLEAEGKNPFMDYHVPSAALTLKQGFGRLIRSRSDAGIVALLDARVHRRGYARKLLAGLPGARRTHDLAEVREFWRALAGAETARGEAREA